MEIVPNFQINLKAAIELRDETSPDEKIALIDALVTYAETGQETTFNDRFVKSLYARLIETVKDGYEKYDRISKRNKEKAEKRWSKPDSMPQDATALQDMPQHNEECHGIEENATACNGMPQHATASIKENKIKENKINKKEKEKEKEKEIRPADGTLASLAMIIQKNVEPEKVQKALLEFVKMRRILKKPLTDHALELAIDHLKTLTQDPVEQEAIVNQSIQNGWQGLFPLKPTGTVTRVQPQRQTKVVVEQQYDQRTNNENSGSDIPEFLKKYGNMLKEG